MSKFTSFLAGKARSMLVACALIMVSALLLPSSAQADSANDWLSKAFVAKGNGGSREDGAGRRRGSKGVQVASLGTSYVPKPSLGPSLSGGGVSWVASSSCLNSTLRGVIANVAANYGRVTVSSTCRSHGHNARVGGAKRSHHLTGDAADFRVHGNWGAAMGYIRSSVGGFKHYGGGLFHIDTGDRRTW